jgi:hypothetical protein
MRARILAVIVSSAMVIATTTSPRPARAADPPATDDRPPPVLGPVLGGVATALVPLAVGGAVAATSTGDDLYSGRRGGLHTIAVGLALAPIVSHAAAREWKRAAVFGAITVALAALAIGLCEGMTAYADFGPFEGRVLFPAALALELVVTSVGIVDSMMAAERWRDRHPAPPPNGFGIALGGSFR